MFQNAKQLIFKATKDCNLRCEYCYIHNKDKFKGQMVDFTHFKRVVDKIISDFRLAQRKDAFQFIFHGGEPTLAGVQLMRKMIEYIGNAFSKIPVNLSLGIQTNLTLINEEFCNLFREYDVTVGCSFDGFGESNSLRTSLKKTDVFTDKIKLMEKYDVNFGFLTVVTQQNYEKAFKTTRKITKKIKNQDVMKVNIVEDVNNKENSPVEINGEIYFKNIIQPSIQNWIKKGELFETNSIEYIRNFFNWRTTYQNKYFQGSCGMPYCGGGIITFEMEPNGDVYYCGRYAKEYKEAYVENVFDEDFLELTQYKRFIDRVDHHNKARNELNCDECVAREICNTGCEAFHYSKYESWGIREDIVCDFFKPLTTWMLENERPIMDRIFKTYLEGESGDIDKQRITNSIVNRSVLSLRGNLLKTNNIIKDMKKKYNINFELVGDGPYKNIRISPKQKG